MSAAVAAKSVPPAPAEPAAQNGGLTSAQSGPGPEPPLGVLAEALDDAAKAAGLGQPEFSEAEAEALAVLAQADVQVDRKTLAQLEQVREELRTLVVKHGDEMTELKKRQRRERAELRRGQEGQKVPLQQQLLEDLPSVVPGLAICHECFGFMPAAEGRWCGRGSEDETGCGRLVCENCFTTCNACSEPVAYCAACASDCLGPPDCGQGGYMCPDCIEVHAEGCAECELLSEGDTDDQDNFR